MSLDGGDQRGLDLSGPRLCGAHHKFNLSAAHYVGECGSAKPSQLTDSLLPFPNLSPSLAQVLITKLRSANTVETRQYRKAAKALLVLIPLFGITYLVVLAGPSESGLMGHMFAVLRAVLLSTQAS